MGERKVLNKYFPPDFDPKKVPRMKRDPEKQIGVRMMIPFSMQCNTCGEFMYRGKKFNSLKEDCIGEDYLDIRRFRFYIKCVICSQEITFKTDPEKGDYELESGASRNFESWTDKQATEDEHKKAREEEEKSDNMKQLENRTLDSKIELEIMDALDEIKAVNRRHETVDTAEVLKASAARRERGSTALAGGAGPGVGGAQDEDDAIIANIQFGGPKVHRLEEGDDSDGWGSSGSSGGALAGKVSAGDAIGRGVKGNGKKRAAVGSEGEPKSEAVRKNGGGGDYGEGCNWIVAVVGARAQAVREAEDEAKSAAAGSMGTKVVVKKRKKKRDKGGESESARKAGAGSGDASKSAKKLKSKAVQNPDKTAKPGVGVTATSATVTAGGTGVSALGGLNLLGSYDSSSASENDAR